MDFKAEFEEVKLNLERKSERFSGDGLITYVRRKRRRPALDDSEGEKSLRMAACKFKGKDIGWEHGMVIDGNKAHWMCNWCGLIRYGGGVSRLKKHLAGVCHVKKCPNVPEEVSRSMLDNLLEKQNRRKKRLASHPAVVCTNLSSPSDLVGEDAKKSDLENQLHGSVELTEGERKKSPATSQGLTNATPPPKTTTEFFNNFLDKALKDGHVDVQNSVTNGHGCHAKIKHHWTNVLENMLQLIRMSEGGGIESCIFHALAYGPYGFTREFNLSDPGGLAKLKGYQDKFSDDSDTKGLHQHLSTSDTADFCSSKPGSCHKKVANMSTTNCQKFFIDVICSEKFALLCELISDNFHENKAKSFFDFSFINSKMKKGEYEQSPASFFEDMQQIWNKFKKFGKDMVFLANSLSSMSQVFLQMQAGKDVETEANEFNAEEHNGTDVARKNTIGSYSGTLFTLDEAYHSAKPDQAETSGLHRACICKKCGSEANRERSLVCGGCDAAYHFSCIKFNNKETQNQRWYCVSCGSCNQHSTEPVLDHSTISTLHQSCAVCAKLDISLAQNDHNGNTDKSVLVSDLPDSSASRMEPVKYAAVSLTAKSGLCKVCGTSEEDDMRFLVCSFRNCPYKFYHVKCLRTSQIASSQQLNKPWYCPSCLCRGCFLDKDDDQVFLCDNCDEAYHSYCMKPPRSSAPKGLWYCLPCNIARAKNGMKRYEQWILQQHSRNYPNEAASSMDLLISAAEKLKSEELIADH